MAEAHQAVGFQFTVTDEGVLFHVDKHALCSILVNIWSKSIVYPYHNIRRAILKGIFPATPYSFILVTAIITAIHGSGYHTSIGISSLMYSIIGLSHWLTLVIESLTVWILLCFLQRFSLKCCLLYNGWMFDDRRKPSISTKVFGIVVKLLAGTTDPLLNSYQHSLPRLPLPSIDDTCRRYLDSVRPLCTDEEYADKVALVEEFKKGPAYKLQRYLRLKSWMSSNYVTDWWERYVYLRGRGSIMINSNYYACDFLGKLLNPRQVSRAAVYIHGAMIMKKEIEDETLKPLIINKLIPLCSSQYKRLFGTCRIPGEAQDTLLHVSGDGSNNVVVYRCGRWYKMAVYHRKRLLNPAEIEWQLQQIIDDDNKESVYPGEEHLPALTASDRTYWANVRNKFFSTGINKQYMNDIEKSPFFLNLDKSSPEVSLYGDDVNDKLYKYCTGLIHGDGYKFWFDKSISCIVYNNGRVGVNAEHSWADAPIVGHMLEYISNLELPEIYNDDGTCVGEVKAAIKPQRMKWDISEACKEKIDVAYNNAQLAINDVDLYVHQHEKFGKGIIKKCGFSPDAFIQMALQMAYYKDAGRFSLTYEASMTRLYLEGRTETVRPCTIEAAAFVHSMMDPNATKEERKRLLKIATDKHVMSYKDSMIGKGIDRHLFCLYVVSRGKELPSPFLDSVISEQWKLSTSQTPTQQTGRIDFNNFPNKISPGGGFGPVAKDGYGVSYIIPGDYIFYFHVSSFKSSPHTDSRRFCNHIQSSMDEMTSLFDIVVTPEDGFKYNIKN